MGLEVGVGVVSILDYRVQRQVFLWTRNAQKDLKVPGSKQIIIIIIIIIIISDDRGCITLQK
jgi:hypothetical protein